MRSISMPNADTYEKIYDERAALVKDQLAQESAERDARTEKLRAMRLAQQASEQVPVPVKVQLKRART